MRLRTLLVVAWVVLSGCAKGKDARAAPPGDYGGVATTAAMDGNYAAGGAMPEEAPPPPMAAPTGEMEPSREFASPTPTSTPGTTVPRGEPTGGQGGGGEPAVDTPKVDPGARHIVYTAGMIVSVFNLEDAMVKAEAIPDTWGGYIQSMSTGVVVLRVPSKSLRKVMDEVGDYGVVEQRSLMAQDVTAEFVDIDSRLRALEETHKQLLELLSKARTVKEALEVREALDRITGELEVLKGRMRQLENLISFSTLTLTLQERGPHVPTPSSNDPFPWVNDLGVESTEWR